MKRDSNGFVNLTVPSKIKTIKNIIPAFLPSDWSNSNKRSNFNKNSDKTEKDNSKKK